MIIAKHGKENVSLLFPIFENYLNKEALDEKEYDLVREGIVIFTGALAKHLAKDDPKVHTEVSTCFSSLVLAKHGGCPCRLSRLLDKLMNSDKYGERRGAGFGLTGVIMGFGI